MFSINNYINDEIEIVKKTKQILDPKTPWREPICITHIYILWKNILDISKKFETIEIETYGNVFEIHGKKLILNCNTKSEYNGKLLKKSKISKKLWDFIKNN